MFKYLNPGRFRENSKKSKDLSVSSIKDLVKHLTTQKDPHENSEDNTSIILILNLNRQLSIANNPIYQNCLHVYLEQRSKFH